MGLVKSGQLCLSSLFRVAALFCADVDCSDVYTQTDDVISPCPADSYRPAPLVSQDGCCVIHQRSAAFSFIFLLFFMPPPSYVVRPEALCFLAVCACMSPSVSNVVNTISSKVLDLLSPDFQHWCILGQG